MKIRDLQNEGCAAHGTARALGCFFLKPVIFYISFPQVDYFLNARSEVVSWDGAATQEFPV